MMRKIKRTLSFLAAGLVLNAFSANVEWSSMQTEKWSLWTATDVWEVSFSGDRSKLYSYFELNILSEANGFTLCANPVLSGPWVGMRVSKSELGFCVDAQSMPDAGEYFYATYAGGADMSMTSDYDVFMKTGEACYFAIVVDKDINMLPDGSFTASQVYGWVELSVDPDGNLIYHGSAVDLDGGAMYVGGGAVPEPTGGLLLVAGLAALCLRRRVAGKRL